MKKGSLARDTFEQLAEMGQSTAKKTVKSVAQTFNPLQVFENESDRQLSSEDQKTLGKEGQKKDKHTPLNFDKLDKDYQKTDSQKQAELRNHLFQLVKSGERELIERNEQEKKQKEQIELQEKEDKRKKEEERRLLEQDDMPKGKERKSILAPKKQAEKSHAEYKPSSGKS